MGGLIFQILVFLASFLLFQIELIIAKFYLPSFGGEFWVWGACVVFFQATLLLGYAQAHFVFHRLGISRYKIIHIFLLLLPLFFFPGHLLKQPNVIENFPLVLNVFVGLVGTIGAAFFVLSTLSIVLQSWVLNSSLKDKINPYSLYAISNVGSFAALLSYPFFFERYFDLIQQQRIWQAGYLLLLIIHGILYILVPTQKSAQEKVPSVPLSRREMSMLLVLGAAGSVMFMSVTNIVTAEVAPIPLFWVIPLFIYLLSFTLNFKKNPWCPRFIEKRIDVILGLSGILYFLILNKIFPFIIDAGLLCVALFLLCMFCQRQIYLKHPADAKNMTLFYVIFSFGSFLGGVFVSWIAPSVFTSLIEYLIGILLVCVFLVINEGVKNLSLLQVRILAYFVFVMLFWPLFSLEYDWRGVVTLVLAVGIIFRVLYGLKKNAVAVLLGLSVFLVSALTSEFVWKRQNVIVKVRNYYGIYTVDDRPLARYLSSYTTLHGVEWKDENKKGVPTMYYAPKTAVGKILGAKAFDFKRVGIIGLGAGTLAAYAGPNESFDFYEIDPDMVEIAKKHFSFLGKARGKINIILGDGRISLGKMPQNSYDALIVDAYSGDAIPLHLLSIEAIQLFQRAIHKDGILIFHVSNRYMNVTEIMGINAQALGAFVLVGDNLTEYETLTGASHYLVVSWNKEILDKVQQLPDVFWGPFKPKRKILPWTDNYSNPLNIFQAKEIWEELKRFKFFS